MSKQINLAGQPSSGWRPLFALEGPSGSGKSTLLSHVGVILSKLKMAHTIVSNNGVGDWEPVIRGLANSKTQALTLAFATAAARSHIRETVTDGFVVSDRFVLSGLVCQVYAGIHIDTIYAINRPLLAGVTTILLEIGEDELKKRRQARGLADTDWYKQSMTVSEELHLYTSAAEKLQAAGHRIIRLPASNDPEALAQRVVTQIYQSLDNDEKSF